MVKSIDKSIARRLILNQIARNPATATLDGVAVLARLGDVSNARKMQLAGVLNITDGAELIVALADGAAAPIPNKSELVVNDEQYDIQEVQPMTAKDCYQLTISKVV